MSKIKRVRYFTKDKLALINPKNMELYERYLKLSIVKNKDVKDTTYKVYKNNFQQFLVYLSEEWGEDTGLYDEFFAENAIDIMEGFMIFCDETLQNNKKAINNKLSAVSSFFHWAVKRKDIPSHPFDGKLERMKNAKDEVIINSHFLTQEEVDIVTETLEIDPKFDIQDRLIWNIMVDSCNRVGAIAALTISSLDIDEGVFEEIREKRGERVEVSFEPRTGKIIEEWLEMRKDMDNLENDAFFVTKYNGEYRPMVKATIQGRIKKIGKILGIDDFRSHSIRKTASNIIVEETGDLSLAAEMLNHKSVETTKQHYVKPQSKSDTRKKIREAKAKAQAERNKKK